VTDVAPPPSLSVLFVDDETNIRAGLQRMLRPMRNVWRMRFASGGAEALEMMSAQPADVVVSDMRMPGMDGGQLLAAVEQCFPQTARIVLSGQCDQEVALCTIGGTHVFLSKPCGADQLIRTVTRAWRLRPMYGEPRIARAVAALRRLPRLPAIYHDLVTASHDPDVSIDGLACIIRRDVRLAEKALELANLPMGPTRELATLADALRAHGKDAAQGLVLAAALIQDHDVPAFAHASGAHAVTTGRLGRAIADELGLPRPDVTSAFTAGLLHDLGHLVLPPPAAGWASAEGAAQGGPEGCAREREINGATHAEIGAYLLAVWGLPELIVEAVGFHHDPALADTNDVGVIAAVHAASVIADRGAPDQAYLDRLGMPDLVDRWRSADIPAGGLLPRAAAAGVSMGWAS
jgi:HD-like signal output (HDOD) protein